MARHEQGEAVAAERDSLPAELDTFVGRESEKAEARRQLQDNPVVTLIGPPGVGKTRLAEEIAAQESRAFPGGVYPVNLVGATCAEDMCSAVLTALGIPDNRPIDQTDELLVEFVLAHPRMLLMLDNCEHLVDAVRTLVSTLLRASLRETPSIRVLATSRIRLGVAGEQSLPVRPLPAEEALRLLIDRGSAVREEWKLALRETQALPPGDVESAGRVCAMLDGVPLAIEMTAAWLDAMSIQEIVDHLADRFRLLVAQESDQPNHRSMTAALGSSYVLLTPAAQRMWQVAAIFAGGFDLAAAESVATAAGMDRHEVLVALTSLVRHSVLGTHTDDGRTRYTMLETTRLYGSQLLDDTDQARLRQAHADHFYDLAATAEVDWLSPREIDWLHQIGANVPNIRAALDHYRRVGQHQQGLVLRVNAIQTRYQFMFGQIDEARRWLKTGVAQYPTADNLAVSALALAAWTSLVQGAAEEWPPLLDQCRDTARAAGIQDTSTALLFAEATRVWLSVPERHKARESIDMYVRCADQFAQAGQMGPHFMAVMFAAFSACFLGDRATATRLTQQLVEVAEAAEAPWCIAWAQWTGGLLTLLHGGDLHTALELVQSALDATWKMGDTWLPAWGSWLCACIAAAMGRMELAAFLFGGALQSQRRVRVLVEGLLPWWQVQQQAQKTIRQSQKAATHGAPGEDLFTRHFNRGLATPYDEVMAAALQPLPREQTDQDGEAATPTALAGLSRRERQVAEYLVGGWKNREIADELSISERTVEVHVRSLFRKLSATNRVEVAVKYAELRTRGGAESAGAPPALPDPPPVCQTGTL